MASATNPTTGPVTGPTTDRLEEHFVQQRRHLGQVAYRILGSREDVEDALQTAWLRAAKVDRSQVRNIDAWLTTVVAHASVDILRSRAASPDLTLDSVPDLHRVDRTAVDPEERAVTGDLAAAAVALLLDKLTPAERVAFVLHDMFGVPFADIAEILDRSSVSCRQLASRARRRARDEPLTAGQGSATMDSSDARRRHHVVATFLDAARRGDLAALLDVLAPAAQLRADAAAIAMGARDRVDGATAVASTFSGRALGAVPALVEGLPGAVWLVDGVPKVAFDFAVVGDTVVAIEMVADPEVLAQLDLTTPEWPDLDSREDA